MIPQRIVTVWLGNELPPWALQTIEQAKKLNPSWEVKTVHRQLSWLQDPSCSSVDDEILCQAIEEANSQDGVYSAIAKRNAARSFSQVYSIADIARFALLNYYGGFYLDLDAFPLKPFDSIRDRSFVCRRHVEGIQQQTANDCFFFGVDPSEPIYDYASFSTTRLQTSHGWWRDINYLKARSAFFACKPFDVPCFASTQDVIHFAKSSWGAAHFGQDAPDVLPRDRVFQPTRRAKRW